eukprot:SAG11_NODE_2374_length_3444_cov_2.210762_3_plen_342_part_00
MVRLSLQPLLKRDLCPDSFQLPRLPNSRVRQSSEIATMARLQPRAIPTAISADAWADSPCAPTKGTHLDARVIRLKPLRAFPWDDYDRSCSTFVAEPLQQLIAIHRQFINADGARPSPEEKWSFLPTPRLNQEFWHMRSTFLHDTFPEPTPSDKLSKQKTLENQAYDDALKRYNKLNEGFVTRGQIQHHSKLQQQMRRWHKPLTLAIKQEQRATERHIPAIDRQTYGPYLLLLEADILAVITMHEVLTAVIGAGERGALFSRTALAIGKQVFMEVRSNQREQEKKLFIERRKLEAEYKGMEGLKRELQANLQSEQQRKRLQERELTMNRREVRTHVRPYLF